ncbi:MAG TPA: O-antigen ligase family protein, partial [Chthoniobacterales bacterium]
GVVYLGLALTGSRGGYLSALLSLLCFLVLSLFVLRSAGKYRAAKFGGVGLLVLFAGATATWTFIQHNPKLRDRAAQIVTPDRGRYDLWQPAIKQWQLNPIFGTGSGTYAFYGRQFRSPAMEMDPGDVHNDYLNLLCDYGLVGAAAFALFLVVHVRAGLRTVVELGPRRISGGTLLRSDRLALSIGALSAAAGFALHSVVDFNLHVPPNALVLAFVFGIFANTTLGTSREKERTSVILPIVAAGVAILLLVQSARLLPGEYYAEEARVALRDEYPKKAIRLAETALQHERKNPKIFFYLGRAWRALGNLNSTDDADRIPYYERALAAFDQARQLSPLDGTYPLDMAMLYDKMGRFSEAEWMYGVALARDPLSLTATNMYQLHLDEWQNAGTATTR